MVLFSELKLQMIRYCYIILWQIIIGNGYTWHHVEDGKTMMLVPTDLHQAVRHTGGAALLRKGLVP